MATTIELDAVLDAWVQAWSEHDAEKLLAILTDDCVYEDVTFGVVTQGKNEVRGFVNGALAAVPDFRMELKKRFVTETFGGAEWTMSGTHKGDFPGMPATGKAFSSIRGASIIELQNGRIRRVSDYWDAASFMKQVGLLPTA